MCQAATGILEAPSRPAFDIGEIFRDNGDAFRAGHKLNTRQLKVMRDIERCRTAALGGHVYKCTHCDYELPAYNSCRDRHCPKCQALAQARWIAERKRHILPVTYFHLVFTLPAELRQIAKRNPSAIYSLLFAAASRTLLELGADEEHLGATLGITLVLHTWTRELGYHPHVHGIVTGGGLSLDRQRWIDLPGSGDFLFPVKVLSRLFRGKFLHGLQLLIDKGQVEISDPAAFRQLKDRLYRSEWVVYAKQPFRGAEHVYEYLGRYTHRVAISNHRIESYSGDSIRFRTNNGMTTTVPSEEFIRRFMQHVLPRGFVKIRHYGLLAPGNVNSALATAKELLATRTRIDTHAIDEQLEQWQQFVIDITACVPVDCPACGVGTLVAHPVPRHQLTIATNSRGPPSP